jgi:hypothetical protein
MTCRGRGRSRPRRRRNAHTTPRLRAGHPARPAIRAASRANGRTRPAWLKASKYRGGWQRRRSRLQSTRPRRSPEGCVKFPHHRQCEIPVVAIAVVEGEAGKTPRKIPIDQPLVQLVHGDDIDAARAQMRQHRAQEFGRDLQMMIGLELAVTARADMMQHENATDARKDRSQQMMRAGEVKRSQPGANNVVAELLHQKWLAGWDRSAKLAGNR